MEKFIQEDKIADVVIPLIRLESKDKGAEIVQFKELFGTGFLIGNRGFGMTVAHVLEQIFDDLDKENEIGATHFFYKSKFYPFKIVEYEKHPTEDVAVFRLDNQELKSWIEIQSENENSSCEYHAWGYPKESAEEILKLDPKAFIYPELIFTQGYIRRQINRNLYPTMIFRGTRFYELNELAGSGYSGSPIFKKNSIGKESWKLIGLYVGEKNTEDSIVSYAVNSNCFADWVPTILGCSIKEESLKK